MNSLIKNSVWLTVKIGVSILLFYLIFRNFQKKEIVLAIQSTNLYSLFPALLITFIAFIPATLRWQIILNKGFSFKNLLYLNIGSFFFGTAIPGFIFGDAYRFFAGEKNRLFLDSILLDRGISFFFISLIGLIFSIPIQELPLYLKIILLLLTLSFSVFLIPFIKFLEKINLFFTIRGEIKDLFFIFSHSIILHSLGFIVYLIFAHSIGLNIPIPLLVAYYSLLQPISFVPFTFQGAGLREIVLVHFSKLTSQPSQKFLILGLLLTSLMFITGIICGLLTASRWIKKKE